MKASTRASALLAPWCVASCALLYPIESYTSANGGSAGVAGNSATGGHSDPDGGARGGGTTSSFGGTSLGGTSLVAPAGGHSVSGADTGGGSVGASAGDAGAGAAAGAGSLPCHNNADCAGGARPARCLATTCVPLTSDECPTLLGAKFAQDPNAVFIGAFAPLMVTTPLARSIYETYQLAMDDFDGSTVGGILSSNEQRPLVAILCNNDKVDFPLAVEAGLEHLITNVGIQGVVAALENEDLQYAVAHYPKTLFISPASGSRALAELDSKGLLWAMLGQPADFVPIYTKLVSQTERYLQLGHPLHVAAILDDGNAFGKELADSVLPALVFNAMSTGDNQTAGNFWTARVTNSTPLATVVQSLYQPDPSDPERLPDLVLSFAQSVVTAKLGIIDLLERKLWSNGRPFYILSPQNAATADEDITPLLDDLSSIDPVASQRFTGVDAKPPDVKDALANYRLHLRSRDPNVDVDANNYYDAFYFLIDALAASGSLEALSRGDALWSDLASGMRRLIDLQATRHDIGVTGIVNVFSALSVPSSTIQLYGTLGPPLFNSSSGMRQDPGSVFCFNSAHALQAAVLWYDPSTDSLVQQQSPTCLTSFL